MMYFQSFDCHRFIAAVKVGPFYKVIEVQPYRGSESIKRNFIKQKKKKKVIWILEEWSNTFQMCNCVMDF